MATGNKLKPPYLQENITVPFYWDVLLLTEGIEGYSDISTSVMAEQIVQSIPIEVIRPQALLVRDSAGFTGEASKINSIYCLKSTTSVLDKCQGP